MRRNDRKGVVSVPNLCMLRTDMYQIDVRLPDGAKLEVQRNKLKID
jgi:hypothetical protein